MNQEEIKNECDSLKKIITESKVKLTLLREKCEHPNTFKGNYSYRVGVIQPSIICSDCGSFIKFIEN